MTDSRLPVNLMIKKAIAYCTVTAPERICIPLTQRVHSTLYLYACIFSVDLAFLVYFFMYYKGVDCSNKCTSESSDEYKQGHNCSMELGGRVELPKQLISYS